MCSVCVKLKDLRAAVRGRTDREERERESDREAKGE